MKSPNVFNFDGKYLISKKTVVQYNLYILAQPKANKTYAASCRKGKS